MRNNPLKAPIAVSSVARGVLKTSDGRELNIAGVEIKDMALAEGRADEFLRLVTAQGVEVIQAVNGSDYLLRCEPPIWHWCGNDPVARHYEQCNLSELLLVFGLATLNEEPSIDPDYQSRLKAAARIGSSRRVERNDFTEWGLNISRAHHLDLVIKMEAEFPSEESHGLRP